MKILQRTNIKLKIVIMINRNSVKLFQLTGGEVKTILRLFSFLYKHYNFKHHDPQMSFRHYFPVACNATGFPAETQRFGCCQNEGTN